MEIISEHYIEQDYDQPMIIIIKVRFECDNSDMVSKLTHLLEFLRKFYTSDDNILINLQLINTKLFYSWVWEKALYIARQRTSFPVPIFLTQTTGVKEEYLNSNKSLKNFRKAIGSVLTESTNDEGDCDDIDDENYELALKLTLLHIARLNGVDDESVLEHMLEKYHCLEDILAAVEK